MNEHDEHPPRKRRRWLSGCLVILGTVLLMLVIAWLLLGVLSGRSDEAFRAKGYPTTMDELNEWYVEPPYGENAAEFYLEAATLLKESTFPDLDALPVQGEAELPRLGTPMPEEMRAVIGAFLEHESEAFELIDEGSRFEGVRYPTNFNAVPGGARFPHLDTVRSAMRGQQLRALYQSGQSNTDALLAEYDKLVRVASSLRHEPILISSMVHVAMLGRATSVAERILNENEFSSEQLAELDASLALLLDDDPLVRTFVGERCYSSSVLMMQGAPPIVGDFIRSDYLGAIDEFIAIAEGGLPAELDAYRSRRNRTKSYLRPFSSMLGPTFARSVQSHYETRALVMAARAAVAVQVWRIDGSPLPENSDSFPESVRRAWPIDPFSGEPLIYKRLDEGFIIYSVGGDLVDSGGLTRDEMPKATTLREATERSTGDVIFRILK